MKNPEVDAVISTYNRLDLLKQVYAQLKEIPFTSLTIVDDCSLDGTQKWLKSLKKPNVILNEENLGGPEAKNVGARAGTAPYIAFFDDDVDLGMGDGGWFESCLSEIDKGERIACVQPPILRKDGSRLGFGFVSGCCCIYRRAWFEKVGGFDGRLRYAYADKDLSERAILDGFHAFCVGDLLTLSESVIHLDGPQDTVQIEKQLAMDKPKYFSKWEETIVKYNGRGHVIGIPARDLSGGDLIELHQGVYEWSPQEILNYQIYRKLPSYDQLIHSGTLRSGEGEEEDEQGNGEG